MVLSRNEHARSKRVFFNLLYQREFYLLTMNKLILTFIIMLFSGAALAEKTKSISVIVHADNTTDTLTKKQLVDLYMGRYVAFPDNQSAQPVDTLTPEGLKSLSLIHISEPTRQAEISYAVFCLKKKKK